jgi:hypothetical protein
MVVASKVYDLFGRWLDCRSEARGAAPKFATILKENPT